MRIYIAICGVFILSTIAIFFICRVKNLNQELRERPEPDIVLAEEIILTVLQEDV
jgi:hypothetical protein